MDLYIDTTDNSKIILKLQKSGQIFVSKEIKVNFNQAALLIDSIQKILAAGKINNQDIKKIIVNNQNGSFTSLRIGVVTANALGYALGVPVEAVEETEQKELSRKTKFTIVKPCYSREPDITIKKDRRII